MGKATQKEETRDRMMDRYKGVVVYRQSVLVRKVGAVL